MNFEQLTLNQKNNSEYKIYREGVRMSNGTSSEMQKNHFVNIILKMTLVNLPKSKFLRPNDPDFT